MINSDLLKSVLLAAGIPDASILIFDEDYELPTSRGITVHLAKAFSDWLLALGIQWRESQFDCNKFAKLATVVCDIGWMQTRDSEAAMAFGLFGVPGHMLNVAVHLKQDEADPSRAVTVDDLRVAFYEPQPGVPDGTRVFAMVTLREVTMTPEEIKSCLACEFI